MVYIVEVAVGSNAGKEASDILSLVVTWLSFALLAFIGVKMLLDGILGLNKPRENMVKKFSYKEVFLFSIAIHIVIVIIKIIFKNQLF